ncbi:MAG TPA: hypothetical protein VG413_08070 [Candidatus Dormibacteraeota bacterium]|nr:hypothetical protein [Candidatus Dormibacteraeota bacterium]
MINRTRPCRSSRAPAIGLTAIPGAIAKKTVRPASVGEWKRWRTKSTSASCIIALAVRARTTLLANRGKVGMRKSSG